MQCLAIIFYVIGCRLSVVGCWLLVVGWYCLPDSRPLLIYNPETSSRVTLALLGIGFQTNLIASVVCYWLSVVGCGLWVVGFRLWVALAGSQYRAQRE